MWKKEPDVVKHPQVLDLIDRAVLGVGGPPPAAVRRALIRAWQRYQALKPRRLRTRALHRAYAHRRGRS